jgi:hypothetical protein
VPTRHRVNGRPAIVAFALFALLFILGLLFSTRATPRVKPAPPPAPGDASVEGGGEFGNNDHAGQSESAPQRQDSRKPRW